MPTTDQQQQQQQMASHPVWRYLEDEIDILLHHIQPVSASNQIRSKITSFLSKLLQEKLRKVKLVQGGSSCSRSYLPDGDLDLTLLTCLPCSSAKEVVKPNNNNNTSYTSSVPSSSSAKSQLSRVSTTASSPQDEMLHLTQIFTVLCEEIYRKEEESQNMRTSSDFVIRNVEFINARTKLIHCVVNNVGVDITLNQAGAIHTLLFLEEADKIIGNDHLFKKSLILIKCWCLNESAFFCGQPIIGSKDGMLSSYAISILVLHLFNRFGTTLTHPFAVLRMFFFFYAGFPWESAVLTLEGAKPIQHGGAAAASKDLAKFQLCANRFQSVLDDITAKKKAMVSHKLAGSAQGRFSIRSCNIQDPVDENNNLGISVSRANIALIDKALYFGYTKLESIIGQVSMANFAYNPASTGRGSPPTPGSIHYNANINSNTGNNGSTTPSSMAGYNTGNNIPNGNGDRRRGSRPGMTQLFPAITVPGGNPALSMDGRPTAFFVDPAHAAVVQIPGQPTAAVPISINVPQNLSPPTGTFLKDFFPHASMKHLSAPSQRPDLLDHPMQANRLTADLNSFSIKVLPEILERSNGDALLSDLHDLESAIKFLEDTAVQQQYSEESQLDSVGVGIVANIQQQPQQQQILPEVKEVEIVSEEQPVETTQNVNESVESILEVSTDLSVSSVPPPESTATTASSSSDSGCNTVVNISVHCSPAIVKSKKKGNLSTKSTSTVVEAPAEPTASFAAASVGSSRKRSKSNASVTNLQKGLSANLAKYKSVKGNSLLFGSVVVVLLSAAMALFLLGDQQPLKLNLWSDMLFWQSSHSNEENSLLSLQTNLPTFENKSTLESENRNRIITHWVQLGDSVTFGDFGDIASAQIPAQYAASTGMYLWQKDSVNISSSSMPYFTIANSNFDDAGHYRCLRLLESKSYLVTETIIRISKKPKVKNRPFYKEVKLDGAFQIHLDIEGVPSPAFQWFRNGYPLENEHNQVLVIDKMDRSLAGTYSCEVKNIAGSFLWLEATIAVPD